MALRLSGEICFATGQNEDARSVLLAAARSLMPMDAALGRQTLLLALQAANFSGRGAVEELCSVAGGLLSPARAVNTQATALDYLRCGLLHRSPAEPRQAAALFRRAVEELRGGNVPDQLRWLLVQLGSSVPSELFDDEAKAAVAAEYVRLARARGALTVLPMALLFLADVHIREGRFGDAEAAYTERYDLGVAMGNPGIVAGDSLAKVPLLVWRGREAEARAASAEASADAEGRGLGGAGVSHVRSRLAVLELSLGKYRHAFGHAQYVADEDLFVWGTYVLPDLVEAAVRCNERAAARRAVDRLSARARASGAPWGLGLLAYSRALLAEEADAERFHQEAIAVLDTTRAVTDLARAHLVYGEWLRRQRRRRDARTHLRTAHEMLADMGADAFAERA
jgi:hypothetical protein